MDRLKALITGATGQDGSYLADLLLAKGYEVYGLVRRTTHPPIVRPGVQVVVGDMTDQGSLNRAVAEVRPDEVYNLAAQSFVGASWTIPVTTADVTGLGALRLLEAVRQYSPAARVYQASSSEMYGDQTGLLNEVSSFRPRSPYGVAKVFAHYAAINYRESYGLFTSCGVLFNHESPRRGKEFVTQKIVSQAKGIVSNTQIAFSLGNLEARRDWGYAPEYVEAMWLMLQQDEPDDYVIGTGVSSSIRDFIYAVETAAGLPQDTPVEVDPTSLRPADISHLAADATKAKEKLGWEAKVLVPELTKLMWDGE